MLGRSISLERVRLLLLLRRAELRARIIRIRDFRFVGSFCFCGLACDAIGQASGRPKSNRCVA